MTPETLFEVETSVRIQDDPTSIPASSTDSMSATDLLAVALAGEGKPNSGAYLGAAADRMAGPRGLLSLRNATALELVVETGIPHLRAETIVAAIELGARLDRLERGFKTCISSPGDVDAYLRSRIAHLETENFVALLLDTKNKILASPTISVGTISSTLVHPREVFKPAIRAAASGIIVAHNHPSGNTQPSREDIAVTKRLAEASETLGIELLDHVIIGEGFRSLKEDGHL